MFVFYLCLPHMQTCIVKNSSSDQYQIENNYSVFADADVQCACFFKIIIVNLYRCMHACTNNYDAFTGTLFLQVMSAL